MITIGQAVIVSGSATTLCRVPPGVCDVVLSNGGTASTVWIGQGTAVSPADGFPLPSGISPLRFCGYLGAGGATLYAITSAGSASVGWLVSSASGGTGP